MLINNMIIMTSRSYVLLFLLMLMGIITANDQNDWDSKCNRCRCHWKSSKKTADCRDTGQTSIPSDLHTDIQSLDLSNNKIAGKYSLEVHLDGVVSTSFNIDSKVSPCDLKLNVTTTLFKKRIAKITP